MMDIGRVNDTIGGAVPPRPVPVTEKKIPVPGTGRESQDENRLTQPEEEYFAAAFPSAAKEIHQHVLYQKEGIRKPAALGSVIDRRG